MIFVRPLIYDFVYGKKKKVVFCGFGLYLFLAFVLFSLGRLFFYFFAFVLVVMMTAYLINVCLGEKP